jgi:glycosyltransferase involved in cell wall biosynthesis
VGAIGRSKLAGATRDRRPALIFLAPGDISKGRVEPISWMRTCGAFADRGFDVSLVTVRVRRPDGVPPHQIWAHFGIPPTFRIRVLPTPLTHTSSVASFRFWAGLASLTTAVSVLMRQALYTRPLVVYSRSPILTMPFALLRRAIPRTRRPRLVFETHTLPAPPTWPLVRLADLVVVNSAKLAAEIVVRLGLPRDRVLHAPLGPYVDIRRHSKEVARAKLRLPSDATIACYTGKMLEEQNEFLLQVATEVAQKVPNFRLLLVGGNPRILDWTRRRVAELGLEGSVLLAGFVEPHKVDFYQAAADVLAFYMTSSLKHFAYCTPAKGFEYQATGRPIVAADIPLFEEVFGRDGERAIRVREPTPAAMADAIEQALMLEDAGPMSERAATWVQGRTWGRRAEAVVEALRL